MRSASSWLNSPGAALRPIPCPHCEPKPAYNTVSTIVRILEKKGFVAHKAYGKTHEYYPVVSKDDYARRYMDTELNNFFGGSVSRLVSFFSEHKAISLEETDAILDMLKNRK